MTKRKQRFDDLSEQVLGSINEASTTPEESRPREPKTHLGRETQKLGEATARRVRELEAELRTAKETLDSVSEGDQVARLDPEIIRRSRFSNRDESGFSDQAFEDLKASIKDDGGNEIPIKVRPIAEEDGHRYEIAYGHRRHEACRQLGIPVLARIEELDDERLIAQMITENQYRKDLSAYEEGAFFQYLIDEGLFSSMRSLATRLGIDVSVVSRRLAILRLPPLVLQALGDPRLIGSDTWRTLSSSVDQTEESRAAAISAAQNIVDRSPTPSVDDLTVDDALARAREIIQATQPRNADQQAAGTRQDFYRGGKKVAQLSRKGRKVSVAFSKNASDEMIAKIESLIADAFKDQ